MKNQSRERREKLDTPIMDGDSRPDMGRDIRNRSKTSPVSSERDKRVTPERGADLNRADDFRDAK